MRKKPYPRDGDVAEAIKEVFSLYPLVKPENFAETVQHVLESHGFYTGLLTTKRIWRIYEKLVKRGEIFDYLMVVQESKGNTFT